MKRLSLMIGVLFIVMGIANAQSKQVDTKMSQVTWVGKKVTGEHTGNISIKSGTLQMNDKKISGGELVIDMNSITCNDLENADYNSKLVNHLKSDDFFGVAKYPDSKLVLTKVTNGDSGYTIEGDLTIKGTTHPTKFKVTQNGHVFEGKLVVDRTKYDVRYGSGKFFDNLGDKMIYDDFELTFKVVALQ